MAGTSARKPRKTTSSRAKKTTAAKPKPKPKSAAKKSTKPRTTSKTTKKPAAPRKSPAKASTTRKRKSRAPKPVGLECSYSGKVFRSRLEARWALYLDLLGIDWDYEPCFYKVSDTLYYLPDFYLPRQRIWLEVKGAPFFDAESFAKVVNGVAGKRPLPTRDAPYSPATAIVMGGTFRPLKNRAPHHIAAIKSKDGEAVFVECKLIHAEGGWSFAMGEQVMAAKATGIKASRRPTPEKTKAILEPELKLEAAHAQLVSAYQSACKATFDETSKALLPPASDLAHLQHRRAGRYLPKDL